MPRPARFDHDAILDAALRVVGARGPSAVTTEAVAAEMGGHVGSIYYRFPTKDHLLAQLWLRCARAGQAGMLAALAIEDVSRALETAVLHYPRWARDDPSSARILAVYGREQVAPRQPNEIAAQFETVNDDLAKAIATFTARLYEDVTAPRRRAVTFALLDIPSSAIRRYLLAGRIPPAGLDVPILAAARGALAAV